ncbi:MAG: molecular chaperone DnaJ [Chloroflexi bacterium]|nr:molecular chaperone DnaJ [Chloroflexota bacterium]
MATKRDYYEVLGVSNGATEDDIRRAFRKLARQYHPDVNREKDAEERFKEINEAYEVLSDPEKRRSYDHFGHRFGQDGPAGFGGPSDFSGFGGIEDIFDAFFGGRVRTGTRRTARGSDLRHDLTLTFEEAVFGVQKTIEIQRPEPCGRCAGRRTEPGTQPTRCPVCGGSGELRRAQQTVFGQFVNVMACDRCQGEGRVITTPCSECRGQGYVHGKRQLTVDIPGGVDEQHTVRYQGEGLPGYHGGPPGDLYIVLSIQSHSVFKRQGTDILYDLDINVAQAALGEEIEVPTVDGKSTRVKIPAGTQSGRTIRLRGQGAPHLGRAARGDQVVNIRVVVPQQLSEHQRNLFRELARSFSSPGPEQHGPDKDRGFFDRVKDALGGDGATG